MRRRTHGVSLPGWSTLIRSGTMPAADLECCKCCKDDIDYAGRMLNLVVVGHSQMQLVQLLPNSKEGRVRRFGCKACLPADLPSLQHTGAAQ